MLDPADQAGAPTRRSRRWVLPAIGGAALLAFAVGLTVVIWPRDPGPPPPARPGLDPNVGVTVFFCTRATGNASCGHNDATPAQKKAILARLRSAKAVRQIRYESQAQALRNYKERFKDRKVARKPADIPDSYAVYLRRGSDASAVAAMAVTMPGVDGASDRIHHKLVRRGPQIDVSIFFCVPTSPNPDCRHQEATPTQREAVRNRINTLAGVRELRYESQAEAFKNFMATYADEPGVSGAVEPGDIPDSFQLYLQDPAGSATVARRFRGLPGVDAVVDEGAIDPCSYFEC